MGCCGSREKEEFLRIEQKWDYINLNDFKSTSCLTPFAYGWLWFMLLISITVYAADTFTAVNLLVFDKWSGQVQPQVDFKYTRWIFAGCIILSFLLLAYRWLRALRVMRQGGVAKCYLDPLAARIQCTRVGEKGRGWKRFLVFAELTKSRKGADYVALFAHFSFEAWLRIVFAEGPRQGINAFTLYKVMEANLIPIGDNKPSDGHSPFVQFWYNVGGMAKGDMLQAAILLTMVWTLIIWLLSFISLAISVVLYLIFLWHHIPAQDGGLTTYCRKKINRRVERIVKVKVDKALKKENELRVRQEAKEARDGYSIKTQPTLPDISTDDMPPPLSRQTTMTTLPAYESRPGSVRNSHETVPPLPNTFDQGQQPQLRRHMTQVSNSSWSSYHSNAPLMSTPGDPGYDRVQTPASAVSTPWSAHPMSATTPNNGFPDRTFTPGPPRPGTSQSMRNGPGSYQMEPLPRPGTAMSNQQRRQYSDSDHSMYRGQTPVSAAPYPTGMNGSYFPPIPETGRSTPMGPPPVRGQTPQGPPPRSFTPGGMPPPRSFTASVPPPDRSFTPAMPPPSRFMNASVPPPADRSMTPISGPPSRLMAGSVPPPERSMTPQMPPPRNMSASVPPQNSFALQDTRQPTLPQIDTSDSTIRPSAYTAFRPGLTTPTSTVAHIAPTLPSISPTSPTDRSYGQRYQSFSRPRGPGQRNSGDVNRDSGFDDIINSYR